MGEALEPVPPPSSLVKVRIGSREYNARRITNCATCQHPARMQIEEMIVEGHPYQYIANQFSNVEYQVGRQRRTLPNIDWLSIRTHYKKGHMPVDAEAVRRIAEQRLAELGKHAEGLQERFVDSYMTARLVMQRGFDRISRGEMDPSVRETLAAAKMLEEFEIARQSSESGDVGAWQEAMMVYFTEAQQIMTPEVWDEFVRRLIVNPQLQSLAARIEGHESQRVVDAEVVEPGKAE